MSEKVFGCMMCAVCDILDLSIIQADLGLDGDFNHQNRGFWQTAGMNPDMAVAVRKLPKDVHVESPVCIDHLAFVDKIADLHKIELDSQAEPKSIERPVEVDDQVVECTPQFILRNIPKIEHYYDLDRPLSFDLEDMPIVEAEDLLKEVRTTRVGKVDFIPVESTEFVDDFRSFLEEIFILCPWDQITRKEPTEDNPWHINNSVSKLARALIARKNTLFIFTEGGMTKLGMKEYKPRETKSEPQEAKPDFVRSYGPG